MMQAAIPAFLIVVASLAEVILLRAAMASAGWLRRPLRAWKEPTFGFGLKLFVPVNVGAALLFVYLPTTISFPWRLLLAMSAKCLVVCWAICDEYRFSIDDALTVMSLQVFYFFAVSLLFAVPYLLFN